MKRTMIDMHTHSSASDGDLSPAELARRAKASGLDAIALTDHDTLSGIPEAIEAGRECGLLVVSGVELSIEYAGELHLLGYHPSLDSELMDELQKIRSERLVRADRIIEKLNDMGFYITREDVDRESSGETLGRPHIAHAMVKKGYAKDVADAFDRFVGYGKPAYAAIKKLTLEDAIRLILDAGGVPVWAHPLNTSREWEKLAQLYDYMKKLGLKGIECHHPSASGSECDIFEGWCRRDGLFVTGGSDWHGDYMNVGLGWPMTEWDPTRCYPELAQKISMGESWI